MSAQALNATVLQRNDPSERLAIVRVRPDGWELPPFEPGQYSTLGLPDPEGGATLLKRVYSIASPPGVAWLEFYLALVKEGAFTSLLWPHHPGDRIFLSPRITGRFTLQDVPPDKDLVLIATGTGLAPYMSMVRHYSRGGAAGTNGAAGDGLASAGSCARRWRRCVVVHGARTAAELAYRDELQALARRDPTLHFLPFVSRDPTFPGRHGHVQSLLDEDGERRGGAGPGPAVGGGDLYSRLVGAPLDPAQCHVFLCGNPAMIDDMEARLVPRGFRAHEQDAPGNLHFERYW